MIIHTQVALWDGSHQVLSSWGTDGQLPQEQSPDYRVFGNVNALEYRHDFNEDDQNGVCPVCAWYVALSQILVIYCCVTDHYKLNSLKQHSCIICVMSWFL